MSSLAIGFAGAFAVSAWLPAATPGAVAVADVIGSLWISAVRMTVIPLVVSLLVTSIAGSANGRDLPRLGTRASVIFLLLLAMAATCALPLASAAFNWLPSNAPILTQDQTPATPSTGGSFGDWIAGLIPANPIKAAADGAMLPLIVFSLLFAVALHHVAKERRDLLCNMLQGVADAMLVILDWVIRLAPLGVLCLAFSLGVKAGAPAISSLIFYVAVMCGVMLFVNGCLLAINVVVAGVPLGVLIRTIGPAMLIGFSSRSSVAALPVLLKSVDERLSFPRTATAFLLPLAVSVFRMSVPASQVVVALFVARATGIELHAVQVVTLIIMAVLLSFTVPGVPNAMFIATIPIFETLGLPAAPIGMLLAVDIIPDAFKTMLNVTGHFTAGALAVGPSGPYTKPVSVAAVGAR